MEDIRSTNIKNQMQLLRELVLKGVFEYTEQQSKLLEEQFKHELSKIRFRGEITKEKVKRHGFKFIIQEGVGQYITKNGVRVTDIFFKHSHSEYVIRGGEIPKIKSL